MISHFHCTVGRTERNLRIAEWALRCFTRNAMYSYAWAIIDNYFRGFINLLTFRTIAVYYGHEKACYWVCVTYSVHRFYYQVHAFIYRKRQFLSKTRMHWAFLWTCTPVEANLCKWLSQTGQDCDPFFLIPGSDFWSRLILASSVQSFSWKQLLAFGYNGFPSPVNIA